MNPVVSPVTVTVALGTTAPDVSVTVPRMLAVVSCAPAIAGTHITSKSVRQTGHPTTVVLRIGTRLARTQTPPCFVKLFYKVKFGPAEGGCQGDCSMGGRAGSGAGRNTR